MRKMAEIPVLVGLGNPGHSYAANRHNAGFMFLDFLCSQGKAVFSQKDNPLYELIELVRPFPALLVKPQTYMNRSGEAVLHLYQKRGLDLNRFLIIYDDLAIPLGTMKLKPAGSAGGQKGMADIITRCSTSQLARLRLGIGPRPVDVMAADFVLSDFSKPEQQIFKKLMGIALDSLVCWADQGIATSMSRFNGTKLMDPDVKARGVDK